MATVEALRIEIQQELVKAETNFNSHLANIKKRLDTQDNFDKDTQDTVAKLTERMGGFDTVSSNFATQVTVNDTALKKIQAEQTKGLEEMRTGLENLFSGSGIFTVLQNLVNNHEKTIKDLEDKMKAGSSFSSGDKHRRSILDFRSLSDVKMLEHGGGFLTWADSFRNVFEQLNNKSPSLINLLEKLIVEQVEQKKKDIGTSHVDAIFDLFRDKGERPDLEY